jgi:sec-independent protein translocase protein TatA
MLLFLNDISGSEILLILVFILIFFGSKSIPGIARTLGKTMRQIKDASNELQSEIKKSGVDIKKDLNLDGLNLDSLVRDTANEIQRPLDQYVSDLDNAVQFEKPKQKPTINVAPNQNPTEKPNDAIENKTSDQSIPPVTNRQETAN